MSDIFNFKRFGKFLAYDLNNAKGSYGLSLLITGMMPAILFFFFEFFSVVFDSGFNELPMGVKTIILVCSVFVIVMVSPSKLYGHLTEKRKGTDWIMVPASALEKTLTLFIILCVVVPAVFIVVYFGMDGILSVLFPNTYGSAMYNSISHSVGPVGIHLDADTMDFTSHSGFIGNFVSLCIAVLAFALGAVCFKKNKIGKTILCWFALFILLLLLIVIIFGHGFSFTSDDFERILDDMDPERVEFWFNFISIAARVLVLGGLMTAIYFRIKTIKH